MPLECLTNASMPLECLNASRMPQQGLSLCGYSNSYSFLPEWSARICDVLYYRLGGRLALNLSSIAVIVIIKKIHLHGVRLQRGGRRQGALAETPDTVCLLPPDVRQELPAALRPSAS